MKRSLHSAMLVYPWPTSLQDGCAPAEILVAGISPNSSSSREEEETTTDATAATAAGAAGATTTATRARTTRSHRTSKTQQEQRRRKGKETIRVRTFGQHGISVATELEEPGRSVVASIEAAPDSSTHAHSSRVQALRSRPSCYLQVRSPQAAVKWVRSVLLTTARRTHCRAAVAGAVKAQQAEEAREVVAPFISAPPPGKMRQVWRSRVFDAEVDAFLISSGLDRKNGLLSLPQFHAMLRSMRFVPPVRPLWFL